MKRLMFVAFIAVIGLGALCSCTVNSSLKGKWKLESNTKLPRLEIPLSIDALDSEYTTMDCDLYFKDSRTVYVFTQIGMGAINTKWGVKCNYVINNEVIKFTCDDNDFFTGNFVLEDNVLTITLDNDKKIVLSKIK